jgi:hypothetical protein
MDSQSPDTYLLEIDPLWLNHAVTIRKIAKKIIRTRSFDTDSFGDCYGKI